jgi:uncharacterized protein YdeI (YjbR/CyaY-like superfamily)
VSIGKQLHFANKDEWRMWLEAHHATARVIWLIHFKKHTGQPGLSLEEAVEEALCLGWNDSAAHRR